MSKRKKTLTKTERHRQDIEQLILLREKDRKTQAQAAEAMRVSVRTIKYWEASEEYKSVRNEMREDWREAVITKTHEAGDKALSTLIQLLDYPNSGHVQFEAAAKILDYLGITREEKEAKQDDRSEFERLAKIMAEAKPAAPAVGTVNVYTLPPQDGGFLPKQLQRVLDVEAVVGDRLSGDQEEDVLDRLAREE